MKPVRAGGMGGSGVSISTDRPVPKDFRIVRVFYATDRAPGGYAPDGKFQGYLNERSADGSLAFGNCDVSVPYSHVLGSLETPTIWRLEIHANPKKHFLIRNCTPQSKVDFFKDIRALNEQSSTRAAFVFIHGYNVSFHQGVMRTAQLAVDLKFEGAAILYSWPSGAEVLPYSRDEESVGLTVPQLTTFLKDLAVMSGATVIHLIAHSMGNRALVAAMDRIQLTSKPDTPKFRQIVLTAPDIGKEEVLRLSSVLQARAERVTLYASSKDKALLASTKLHGYTRAGYVVDRPFIFPGINSIDASSVRTDLLAHSVFATSRTVLTDLFELIHSGNDPDRRFGLEQLSAKEGKYWAFKK